MNCTKANVKRILTQAGFTFSQDSSSGRKVRSGTRSINLGVGSEGVTMNALQRLDGGYDIYVSYSFSTFSHPNDADYARRKDQLEKVYELLSHHFIMATDDHGTYFFTRMSMAR